MIHHGCLEVCLLAVKGGDQGRDAPGHRQAHRYAHQSPAICPPLANPSEGHVEKERGAEQAEIRRLPVPSADPADPLNWAPWRKFAALLVGSIYAFTGNYLSANVAPALALWFETFPRERKTYPELVYFVAVSASSLTPEETSVAN